MRFISIIASPASYPRVANSAVRAAARRHDGPAAEHPEAGAAVASLAHGALAGLREFARVQRLTRNQHVLFRLGELIARVEASGAMAGRAARAAQS